MMTTSGVAVVMSSGGALMTSPLYSCVLCVELVVIYLSMGSGPNVNPDLRPDLHAYPGPVLISQTDPDPIHTKTTKSDSTVMTLTPDSTPFFPAS